MTKILVADALSAEGVEKLKAGGAIQVDVKSDITPEQLLEEIGQYAGVVIRSRTTITADVIAKGDNLKVIGRAGAGLDNVDIPAATQRGIVVMNTPGGNTISAAEHAFGLMLAAARNIPAAHQSMVEGRWDKKKLAGNELNEKTLGVVGLGRIGLEFTKRAQAFNMKVVAFDPFLTEEMAQSYDVTPATIDELVVAADFITIHAPKTPETANLFNADLFKKMKNTAILINAARGGIVVENDLVAALQAGEIAGAALDVFETEPLPEDHPLRKAPNVVLTPHLAASTVEAQENVAAQVAEQIVTLLTTGQIRNAANAPDIAPDVLKKVRPYLDLGEDLGRLASQLCAWPVKTLRVEYLGDVLDYPIAPITTAIGKGFVEPHVDSSVNYVNAMHLLHGLGVDASDTRKHDSSDYNDLITLRVESEAGETLEVSGTLFTASTARIVSINDKRLIADPSGNMLVLENKDIPGVIRDVTTVLAKHEINIGQMSWGRTQSGETAMTLVNLDAELTSEALEEIRALEAVEWAKFIVV